MYINKKENMRGSGNKATMNLVRASSSREVRVFWYTSPGNSSGSNCTENERKREKNEREFHNFQRNEKEKERERKKEKEERQGQNMIAIKPGALKALCICSMAGVPAHACATTIATHVHRLIAKPTSHDPTMF
jgi:hypothetical protein